MRKKIRKTWIKRWRIIMRMMNWTRMNNRRMRMRRIKRRRVIMRKVKGLGSKERRCE